MMGTDKTEIRRVSRSRAQARASYDRLSRWYDLLGSSERKLTEAGLELLDLRPGQGVLEIGFGTGQALVVLAERVGATGQVFGVDISAGMCGVAQARVRRAGLEERVTLWCGDATRLACPDGVWDAALMSFALELFDTPEIPVVLGECRRVLRSGGRLAVVALSRRGGAGAMLKSYEWAHDHFPQWVDCRPILAERALAEAGFRVAAAARRSMWGLGVEIVVGER
jgi:demethylmenaquinone methyltransferase/2-methoxy-6-polyprenyl-1,4-benzoquinol methylase